MERSTNALAELAETLKWHCAYDSDFYPAVGKAQRIVAELAKFKETNYFEASESQMFEIITKCRAIAEEGAGDGK